MLRNINPLSDVKINIKDDPSQKKSTNPKKVNTKIITLEFTRKNITYVSTAKVYPNSNTDYQAELLTFVKKDTNETLFNSKNNERIFANIFYSEGENYSDLDYSSINKQVDNKYPRYIMADHKLRDMKGWVLYLNEVYPNSEKICVVLCTSVLMSVLKYFEIFVGENVNKASVWLASLQVVNAFNCYKNAFQCCAATISMEIINIHCTMG